MLATYFVPLVFAIAAMGCAAYWLASRGHEEWLPAARWLYHGATFGTLGIATVLMYLIQTDQFQYTYVWEYSSRELGTLFKYSAFYSGQEGSFLLWSLFVSLIGVPLMQYARRQKYELEVMRIYSMVQAFLLMMIVVKNPFEQVWQSFASEGVVAGFIPQNGRGLNPLLQNYWIAIHPPCLFLGFAAMTVPFSFAVAGLHKRDYQGWISTALPWTLFGAMVLGFGIMLGGFWAYETLGWGGFWGWDPVENSSLIPWIVCVGLVHTMLTQKRTRGLVKTNFVLAVSTFLLVLYSTFLTRSGVLGDTSVHSFVSPGMFAYILLLVFLGLFAVVGIWPIIQRAKELIPLGKEYRVYSRETALGIGSAVLSACAVVVLLGTSWPLFAKAAVDTSFYNNLNLPIAILISLINGLSMLLKWRDTQPKDLLRHSMVSMIIAMAATSVAVYFGLHDVRFILLALSSFFALIVNAQVGWRVLRGNPKMAGAYVSHFGIALLFLGIVAVGYSSQKTAFQLCEGEHHTVFGYTFTYLGKTQIEKEKQDREKFEYNVEISKGDERYVVQPVAFWSDFNKREAPVFNPGIKNMLVRDVYVAPQGVGEDGGPPLLTIKKGETMFDTVSHIKVTFVDFDFDVQMKAKMLEGKEVKMGAKLEMVDETGRMDTTTAYLTFSQGNPNPIPHVVPGTQRTIYFVKPEPDREHPEQSRATIAILDKSHPAPPLHDVIALEVSIKPFINLVWAGTLVMVLGFVFAMRRRSVESKKELERLERTTPQS